MNWQDSIKALVLVVLVSTAPNGFAASWKFVNAIADKPWCEFEMPLQVYLKSADFLAEIRRQDSGCIHSMAISGSITIEDIERLDSLVSFYNSNPRVDRPFSINLNSPGGSVSAALAIASSMRDPHSPLYQVGTFVGQNSQCLSSCTYILAAGFQRSVFGEVGIHRPRFLPGDFENMGYENLQAAYSGLYDHLSTFFSAANLHPSFIDAMWNVPSSEIRMLSKSDLSLFRLSGTDLVRQEEQILKLIQACGEAGPNLKRDFKSVIGDRCTEANGKVDTDCFANTLKNHPYGECYERLN